MPPTPIPLFDFDALVSNEPVEPATPFSVYGESTWVEVPARLFFSWSPARQYAYCAARDEDSAQFDPDLTSRPFFVARAAHYRTLQHQCRTTNSN